MAKAKQTQQSVEKTQEKESVIRKRFSGEVVSKVGDKTIAVKVDSIKIHPKYKKRYYVNRKYQVHDEKNQYKVGDKVKFVECRPYSKAKRWRVVYNK